MTNEQLIADLSVRYPTFTIVQDEELIRVEMPEPFKSPVWIRLFEDAGTLYAGPSQESIRGDKSHKHGRLVFKVDCIDEALWHAAYSHRNGYFPPPEELTSLIGGPFDGVARTFAQRGAKGCASTASQLQAIADKARRDADRAQQSTDHYVCLSGAYTKILETV